MRVLQIVLAALRNGALYVAHFAGVSLLGLVLIVNTILVFGAILLLPRERQRAVGRRLSSRGFGVYVRMLRAMRLVEADLSALDALVPERALVIAPNHPSMFDAILIISRLPNVTCIMKAELQRNPFLGAGARGLGYIRNDSLRSMVRRAVEDLRRDGHLLIFPEGTRTVTPPVNPLRGAFALIAKQAGVPVQVLIVETNSAFLGKGWPLWRKPEFPLRYRIRLGPRIAPDGSVDELTETVRAAFERELWRTPNPLPPSAPARAVDGARSFDVGH